MNHKKHLAGCLLAFLTTMAVAQEQTGDPPAEGAVQAPEGVDMQAMIGAVFETCDADIKKVCEGKEGPQAMMCLMAIKDEGNLDKDCKKALDDLPPPQMGDGPPPGDAPPPAN